MAGRNPQEAERNFFVPLIEALSCVTLAGLQFSEHLDDAPRRILVLNSGEPVPLSSAHDLSLVVSIWYRIIEAPPPAGPWKTTTSAWYYELERAGSSLLRYHWHPSVAGGGVDLAPHLHIGDDEATGDLETLKGHMLPTGRIALEQVLRMAIEEFGVSPIRGDWAAVLNRTQGRFEEHRTWA